MGADSQILTIGLGQEEQPVNGRSVQQCLDEMKQQGWDYIRARATADVHGILCEYDFWRPLHAPQSTDLPSIVSEHMPPIH
jgi:hypothetical protein